jgi:DNA-binding transcriptional LysR family regulator
MTALTVTRLRCLRELAIHGSIAAAAERLWLTPSAVSQQLAALQRETNVQLVERSGRGVRLTAAGRTLADHSDRVFRALEAAEAALEAFQREPTGRIRVAVLPSLVELTLAAMQPLQAAHADLTFEIEDLEADQSLPALDDGRADVAVIDLADWVAAPRAPGMEAVELFDDPLVAAYASDHPLASAKRIEWDDLADESWVIGQPAWSFLVPVFEHCRKAGFEPKVIARVRDKAAALGLLRQGWGIAVLPRLVVAGHADGVAWRVVESPVVQRSAVAVTSGSGGSVPAVRALIERLQEGPSATAAASSQEAARDADPPSP